MSDFDSVDFESACIKLFEDRRFMEFLEKSKDVSGWRIGYYRYVCYCRGFGVDRDLVKAHELISNVYDEMLAAAYGVLWYNSNVLLGRRKPIPIDRKRCKAIVSRNLGTFCGDDTGAEVCAHVRAPLSVFRFEHPTASSEIGERPFPFSDGCAVRLNSEKGW